MLCLSSVNVNLLDANTKLLIRSQPTSVLQQWRIGGGVSKHQIVLEFKQTRWQLVGNLIIPLALAKKFLHIAFCCSTILRGVESNKYGVVGNYAN